MRSSFLRLAAIMIAPILTGAQSPSQRRFEPDPPKCQIKLAQAPTLRGFRLGMTEAEVKAVTPQVAFRQIADLRMGFLPSGVFEGVKSIGLDFKEGRLTRISVDYDNSIQWDTVEQFTEKVAQGLKLPMAGWHLNGKTNVLSCDGFSVDTFLRDWDNTQDGATLILTDTAILEAQRKQREEQQKKQRESFKP